MGSRYGEILHPEPTHFATGISNFRGGSTLIFKLTGHERTYLMPMVTVDDAISDLPYLKNLGKV